MPINESSCSFRKKHLAPLGITTAASAIDAGIQKTYMVLEQQLLIISNEEINDIIEIFQALEDSILLKGVTKAIKNKREEKKGEFLSILLGTLRAGLLGNLLVRKGIVRTGSGNKERKGIARASSGK